MTRPPIRAVADRPAVARMRWTVGALLSCAVLGDAAVGALWPAVARAPLLPVAVVAGVGLASGVRAGMVTGFAAGLVLDLLSGPVSVAGVHALTALTVGAVTGRAHWHPGVVTTGFAVLTGGLASAGAALLFIGLQRSLDHAVSDTMGTVVTTAFAVGSVATPIVLRILRRSAGWPLSLTSVRT